MSNPKLQQYLFYAVSAPAHKSTLIGGGFYADDNEAIEQGLDYAGSIQKTLGSIATVEGQTVWTLRNGKARGV